MSEFATAIRARGPIAALRNAFYYALDEASGATAPVDTAVTAADVSAGLRYAATANVGAYVNSPTVGVTGKVPLASDDTDRCVYLDGTSKYLTVATTNLVRSSGNGRMFGDFTDNAGAGIYNHWVIGARFLPDAWSDGKTMWLINHPNVGATAGWLLQATRVLTGVDANRPLQFRLYGYAGFPFVQWTAFFNTIGTPGSGDTDGVAGQAFCSGTLWGQIELRCNGSGGTAGTFDLYFNGRRLSKDSEGDLSGSDLSSATDPTPGTTSNTGTIAFGLGDTPSGNYFKGHIAALYGGLWRTHVTEHASSLATKATTPSPTRTPAYQLGWLPTAIGAVSGTKRRWIGRFASDSTGVMGTSSASQAFQRALLDQSAITRRIAHPRDPAGAARTSFAASSGTAGCYPATVFETDGYQGGGYRSAGSPVPGDGSLRLQEPFLTTVGELAGNDVNVYEFVSGGNVADNAVNLTSSDPSYDVLTSTEFPVCQMLFHKVGIDPGETPAPIDSQIFQVHRTSGTTSVTSTFSYSPARPIATTAVLANESTPTGNIQWRLASAGGEDESEKQMGLISVMCVNYTAASLGANAAGGDGMIWFPAIAKSGGRFKQTGTGVSLVHEDNSMCTLAGANALITASLAVMGASGVTLSDCHHKIIYMWLGVNDINGAVAAGTLKTAMVNAALRYLADGWKVVLCQQHAAIGSSGITQAQMSSYWASSYKAAVDDLIALGYTGRVGAFSLNEILTDTPFGLLEIHTDAVTHFRGDDGGLGVYYAMAYFARYIKNSITPSDDGVSLGGPTHRPSVPHMIQQLGLATPQRKRKR